MKKKFKHNIKTRSKLFYKGKFNLSKLDTLNRVNSGVDITIKRNNKEP